jgi:hypothetical protein
VSSDFPFTYATYPHYNQLTGGSWTRTAVASTEFVNYYLVAVPAITSGLQFMWIMGQAKHTTLSAAQSETFSNLAFGNLPVTEFAALYRITFGARATYAGTTKSRIESVTRIVGSATIVNQTGVNTHSGLSGTTDPDSHPATAISVDAAGFDGNLATTDDTVQKVAQKLDDYTPPAHNHTGTYDPAGTAATAVSTHAGLATNVHAIPHYPTFSGIVTAAAQTYASGIPMLKAGTVTGVAILAGTGPTGASLTLQLLKNGANFGATQALTAGNTYVSVTGLDLSYSAGDIIKISFTTVGSPAAADVTITLTCVDT